MDSHQTKPSPGLTSQSVWTYFSLCTACSSSMSMALCGAWTSPVLGTLPDGAVNDMAVDALLPASAAVGVLLGWVATEAVGRKPALTLAGLLFLVGWTTIASAAYLHYYLIYPGRVFSGLGAGIVNIASTIYIAEMSPPELRGSMYALAQVFTNLGLLLEYTAGAYLDYFYLSLISAVHPLFFTLSSVFIPESPYYLVSADKSAAAEAVLRKIRSNTVDIPKELKTIQAGMEGTNWRNQWTRITSSRKNLRALAVCGGANIARQMTGGHAILSYAHTIFFMAGVATSPQIASIILASVKTLSSSLTTSLTARYGIKKLLVFSCSGVTLFLTGLSIYFILRQQSVTFTEKFNWFPLVTMILYFIFQDLGINPFPSFIGAEIFRGEVKGLGTGLTQSAGFVANTLSMALVTGVDLRVSLGLFAGCTLVSTPLLYRYLSDTHGMSLEEAQAHIYSKDIEHHM